MLFKRFREYFSNKAILVSQIRLDDTTARLTKCDIVLFCHDADRGVNFFGKAYSPILDSVREELESRGFCCQSIAFPFSRLTGNKAQNVPIAVNRSYLVAYIADRLLAPFITSPSWFRAGVYTRLLRRSDCKLVLTIGAKDEICQASRGLNLLQLELLHGLGYPRIPWGWDTKPILDLPSGIVSLDDVSTRTFSKLSDKGVHVATIPHPFLRKYLAIRQNSDLCKMEGQLDPIHWTGKRVMVALTSGYAGDHGDQNQYRDILPNGLFYQELESVVSDTRDRVFWHFRMHPAQLRGKRYHGLREFMDHFVSCHPNTEWRYASEVPLPAIAVKCAGQVSMISMSCYDTACLGVPSLMLCPTLQPGHVNADMFEDLVAEGYVEKATVSYELVKNWVLSVEKKSPRLTNLLDDNQWNEAFDWMIERSGLSKSIKDAS